MFGSASCVVELSILSLSSLRLDVKRPIAHHIYSVSIVVAFGCQTANCAPHSIPFCANPVKSIGAGDRFNAGYCVGLMLRCEPLDRLQIAVATSGAVIAFHAHLLVLLRLWLCLLFGAVIAFYAHILSMSCSVSALVFFSMRLLCAFSFGVLLCIWPGLLFDAAIAFYMRIFFRCVVVAFGYAFRCCPYMLIVFRCCCIWICLLFRVRHCPTSSVCY